jgi:hypothetical protein
MKLSEKYLQHLQEEIDGEQGITPEEIKNYGELCKLEAEYKYSMLASGMDANNKVYWDELASLTKKHLDELAKNII